MSKRLMQTLAALACRRSLDPLHVVAEQQKTISSVVLDRHLERIGNELGDYAHLLRVEYDTLRTANQRLEGEVARLREALEGAGDAGTILRTMIENIESKGNYTAETTVLFMNQALGCIDAALAGDGGE